MNSKLRDILSHYREWIDRCGWSSYTIHAIDKLVPLLDMLKNADVKSMIDLGCGYKVLTCIVAEYLEVDEVYAVDMSEERLNATVPCRTHTIKADVSQPLHIAKQFDLVTSFGVLEHVSDWDTVFRNISDLTHSGSYLILSMPNLGSWINRLSILLGYQPRDLEISSKKLYHVLPPYRGHAPAGHIKLATYGVTIEMIKDYGFHVIKVVPIYAKDSPLVNFMDRVFVTPSLAGRHGILVRKVQLTSS